MARHINAQFRQEYIESGKNFSSTDSTMHKEQINDISNSNKRKDLSSDDLEAPSPKMAKCAFSKCLLGSR